MLYRSFEQDGLAVVKWKIATEPEAYLQDYIPRLGQFSESRQIKIEDLYDNLDHHLLSEYQSEGAGLQKQRYHRALEILISSPVAFSFTSFTGAPKVKLV
jgi:hypothetical protein